VVLLARAASIVPEVYDPKLDVDFTRDDFIEAA
jgi:hypothetical protein